MAAVQTSKPRAAWGWRVVASATLLSCNPAAFEGYCLSTDPGCAGRVDGGPAGGHGGVGGQGGSGGSSGWGGAAGTGGDAGTGGGLGGSGGTGGSTGTEVFAETTMGGGGWVLATGGGYVYFAFKGKPTAVSTFIIQRKAMAGGEVETIATEVASTLNELHLFADDENVYWTTVDVGAIWAPHANPYAQTAAYPAASVLPFGARAYVQNKGKYSCLARQESATTVRVTGSGWGAVTISTETPTAPISAFAEDESNSCYIAFIDPPANSRLFKLSGAGPQILVEGMVSGIGFSGPEVYYAVNPSSAEVYRHGSPPTLIATGVYLTEVAVDDSSVYYAGFGGAYQAMRVPQGGGAPTVLGESPESFTTLRLGPGHVYWVGTSSNTSMRVFRAPK